jgi:hypothetical protein
MEITTRRLLRHTGFKDLLSGMVAEMGFIMDTVIIGMTTVDETMGMPPGG